jgi:hypothetical protein
MTTAYLIAAYNPTSGGVQMIDPCGLTPGTVIRNLMALREQGAPTFVGKQFKVITNR